MRSFSVRLLAVATLVSLALPLCRANAGQPAAPAPAFAGDEDQERPARPKARGVQALLDRAGKLMTAKKYDEALEIYEEVLDRDPENLFALTQRAWLNNEKGNYAAAIRDCNQAIDIDSQYAVAYRERGFARMKKGLHEQAVKDFTKAIKLNPQDANAYGYRAQSLKELGEDDRAASDEAKAKRLRAAANGD